MFMMQKEWKKLNEAFKKELSELKTTQLERKMKVLDLRDNIIAGEMADELGEYKTKYQEKFTEVEQIAKNITRLEDGVEEEDEDGSGSDNS